MLHLLPRDELVQTSSIDRADWNYRGFLGYVSRRRFRLVASLMPKRRLDRVLEIGYGSGIFIPELARHAARVSGVDVHPHPDAVMEVLARSGVVADLVQATAEALPYEAGTFDVVVAVSALEFVTDVDAALREIARVLKPGGEAIVVTPGDHPLLDIALRLATGASARREFRDQRAQVVSSVSTIMRVSQIARFPRFAPIPLYRAFVLQPRNEAP